MVQHQLTVGQKMVIRDGIFVPSWNGEHTIAVLGSDWALVMHFRTVILTAIIGREMLNPHTGARFKSGVVTIAGDAHHTWAEIQDFRFVQTQMTGSKGVWYIMKWIRTHLDPFYEEQINECPFYGATLKRCIIKGVPIDITEQCV